MNNRSSEQGASSGTFEGQMQRYQNWYRLIGENLVLLTWFLQQKSLHLYHHCLHVQEVTSHFAWSLGLPQEEKLLLELAARFHDIGKIATPDTILEKPARLTPQEFEVAKQHSAFGAQFLMQMGIPRQIARLVYHHHERWDGQGYPDGLQGPAIPLGARIIAIADAFAAMTSHRSYQTTRTPAQAMEELRRGAGTQFDPSLVDHFYNMFTQDLA